MTSPSTDTIDRLLNRVSKKLTIAEFKNEIALFWKKEVVDRLLLQPIRFKEGKCKKFMDEIMPIFRFIQHQGMKNGYVRFPLDNKIPDCLLWYSDSPEPRPVEVTIAKGKARHLLMRELVENGSGRGFVDIQDNADPRDVRAAIRRERACYTTEEALDSTRRALLLGLVKKNDIKYCGMDLLIQAPLNVATLPSKRWDDLITDAVKDTAGRMPFRRIDVIGDDTENLIGFRIK